jgi:hypothetical protein
MSEPDGLSPTGKLDCLHLLLFECPKCSDPVVAFGLTDYQNLEPMEALHFNLNCKCSWSGEQLGATARKHFVERWTRGLPAHLGVQHAYGPNC